MQLHLTTDYALRAVLSLHLLGPEMTSAQVSEAIAVEREFTQKILRRLRGAGLVKSTRGKMGGYSLTRPIEEISLYEILAVTEDTMYVNRCLEEDHFCTRMKEGNVTDCQAHRFYLDFQSFLNQALMKTTVRDIVDGTYSFPLTGFENTDRVAENVAQPNTAQCHAGQTAAVAQLNTA